MNTIKMRWYRKTRLQKVFGLILLSRKAANAHVECAIMMREFGFSAKEKISNEYIMDTINFWLDMHDAAEVLNDPLGWGDDVEEIVFLAKELHEAYTKKVG